jgi:DNA-binding PadR family transcriptional regulator
MEHSFDIEIATQYGIETAVILNNMYFWISKNEANDINYFDGKYWTFNSIEALKKLFPYMSQKKIRSTLDKMESEGLIETGNYNKSQYDRTKWYAITEKAKSILLNGKIHLPETANGSAPEGKPIPDINTDINTDNNNTDSKESVCPTEVRRVIQAWNQLAQYGIPKVTRIVQGSKRYDSLKARIKQYGIDDVLMAIERIRDSDFLQGKNKRGWFIKFDWFVLPNNFPKVLEGNYDNRNNDNDVPNTETVDDDGWQ